MMHRKKEHIDEIPICNDFKEKGKCSRSEGCWYRHFMQRAKVSTQGVNATENLTTPADKDQDFWQTLPTSRPPDQLEKMMNMLKTVMTEISQMKQQMNIQITNQN